MNIGRYHHPIELYKTQGLGIDNYEIFFKCDGWGHTSKIYPFPIPRIKRCQACRVCDCEIRDCMILLEMVKSIKLMRGDPNIMLRLKKNVNLIIRSHP